MDVEKEIESENISGSSRSSMKKWHLSPSLLLSPEKKAPNGVSLYVLLSPCCRKNAGSKKAKSKMKEKESQRKRRPGKQVTVASVIGFAREGWSQQWRKTLSHCFYGMRKEKEGEKVGSDRGEKMGLEKMLDAEKVGGPIYRMTSNIGLLAA